MNTDVKKPDRAGPPLSVVFVALGGVFLLVAYVSYLGPELRVNREFAETMCTVVSKQLVVLEDRNGIVYKPEFHIRYQVGEKWYEANTYNIAGDSASSRTEKEEILARFEIGQSYSCWYDPDNPRVAVLVRGYSVYGFLLADFGVLVLLIGVVGML